MENNVSKINEHGSSSGSKDVSFEDFRLRTMFSGDEDHTMHRTGGSLAGSTERESVSQNNYSEDDGVFETLRERFEDYSYLSSESNWEEFKKKTGQRFRWKESLLFNKVAEVLLFAIITFTIVNWLPQSGLINNESGVNWDKIFAFRNEPGEENTAFHNIQENESLLSRIKASVPKLFYDKSDQISVSDEKVPERIADSFTLPDNRKGSVDLLSVQAVMINKKYSEPLPLPATDFPEWDISKKKKEFSVNLTAGKNFGASDTRFVFDDRVRAVNSFVAGATLEKELTDQLSIEAGLGFRKSSYTGLTDVPVSLSELTIPVRVKYDIMEAGRTTAYVFAGVNYNRMLSEPVESGFKMLEENLSSSEKLQGWKQDYAESGGLSRNYATAQAGLGIEQELGDSSKAFVSIFYNQPWNRKNFKNGILGVEVGMRLMI